jgi:hypothetical protein
LEPDSQDPPEETNVSANTRKKEPELFGRIDEFNADMWNLPTKGWITGALSKSFDSTTIMQPLVDAAMQSVQGSLKTRSEPSASTSIIQPVSHSRLRIAEGIVSSSSSDSE